MPTEKREYDSEQIKMLVDIHRKYRIPYTVILTTYTFKITSEIRDVQFLRNSVHEKAFIAYRMIMADCKKMPMPVIDTNELRYFDNGFSKPFYADMIYNIDVTAAYITILRNDGYVSEKTFSYVMSMDKKSRLVSVGMMASKKDIFVFADGLSPVSHNQIISTEANYFFYCVKKMQEIMVDFKKALHDHYLFTWVDGIYFNMPPGAPEGFAEEIAAELMGWLKQEYNLESKFEKLTDFDLKENGSSWHLEYRRADGKRKQFFIPMGGTVLRQIITNYLLNK